MPDPACAAPGTASDLPIMATVDREGVDSLIGITDYWRSGWDKLGRPLECLGNDNWKEQQE